MSPARPLRQGLPLGAQVGKPALHREALIATGDGDCDTNCAMAGGIVALYAGRESIPEDWRKARDRFDFEDARELAVAAESSFPPASVRRAGGNA